ncbi:hypothetical protein [Sediminibacillus massiliensis]|uniref:hypothetical protein n=1 Tax=Sediminibacillus massiliensis TaxID=1926277 RepID=UPI00098833C6|nr:hypothetical protein [Sediminibacillus massiliensis]
MDELLTTGQMIDRLKEGEIAECVNVPEREDLTENKKRVVKRSRVFLWKDGLEFKITTFISDEARWRILPNYVSFEEAKAALEHGKHVVCEFLDRRYEYYLNGSKVCSQAGSKADVANFNWFELWDQIFEGKWTIKEESK